jgi:hypothetical protein
MEYKKNLVEQHAHLIHRAVYECVYDGVYYFFYSFFFAFFAFWIALHHFDYEIYEENAYANNDD